ncbi:MAG: hypothetical protein R3F24_13320 [Gammaproteobacteria bacterium]
MNIALLKDLLLWCLLANYGVLLVWFAAFAFGRKWLYGLHSRWFNITPEAFDLVHYAGMAIYKVGILLFNLVPLAALYFMANGS